MILPELYLKYWLKPEASSAVLLMSTHFYLLALNVAQLGLPVDWQNRSPLNS